ncbi:tetratricopeptide repeat protein [Paraburkholderia bryophila]|uniref:tetratricopeptide repeat protein n=1 Tax=Paraburkholderia bryophila TaxID=420952 RepID=UPI00234A92E5|nr:tetratricopeptide repeat protein [Paraburkholderia bryophila]WCM24593.1 tetratricopeptide repeat protein [Paraburkholderia bryophila]
MSTSPATPERQRLFSPAVILVLGALTALMLVLAYPRDKLEARLLRGTNTDGLTIAYLEAWLRIDPDNPDVLSELTREYLKGQRIAEASRVLDRLQQSHDPAARQGALAIRVSIAQQRLYALRADDPARAARLRELDALLREAAPYTWDNEQLALLARQARELNDSELAARYYRQLIQRDPAHASGWLVDLAQTELGNGRYAAAANAWFEAQQHADDRDQRRARFIAGVKALQAGNDPLAAIQAANAHLGDLADDPATLRYLANLALAAGRPDLAEQYVKRLLKMSAVMPQGMRVVAFARGIAGDAHAAASADDANANASASPLHERTAALADTTPGEYRNAHGVWLRAAWYRPERQARGLQHAVLTFNACATTNGACNGKHARGPRNANAPFAQRGRFIRIATTTASAPTPAPTATGTTSAATLTPTTTAESDNELAYRVFLANGDVANAQRIAQAALDQDPQSALWRGRLAQVAEWNHQPQVALRNYLAQAQANGDANAWQQVARLAPGLNDNAAVLAVTLHQSEQQPDNLKLIDAVVFSYEQLADPDSALRFLQARMHGAQRRAVMERYALIAERKGDDELALHTWRDLEREFGPNSAYGLKIATLLYTRTQFDAALAAMNEAKAAAPNTDGDFWRFYALLANTVQHPHEANQGYRALIAGGKADADDYEAMTGFYNDSPLDAGRLAEYAYRHGGPPRALSQALYHYQRARAWGRIRVLLASLSPEERSAAEQSATFLLARAEYERQTGSVEDAGRDIKRAARLAPDNAEARAAYLWMLTDRGTDAELRNALRSYAGDAENDPQLWSPYAAASMRLGDGRAALHYLHKQSAQAAQSPLWRLTYADALELNSRIDEAWQLRRSVWLELARRRRDPAQASALPAAEQDDLRDRYVALTTLFDNGDRSRAVLIDMLRADQASQSDAQSAQTSGLGDIGLLPPAQQEAIRKERRVYTAIAREAAISWAQVQDASDMERAWLEKQYIQRSTRPVYAEAQLAINEGDVNELSRLLDTLPDLIPRQNKVDAQTLTGRNAAAQTTAFESLTSLPDDSVMHGQLHDRLLSNAQAVAPSVRYSDQGPLRFSEESITGGVRLTPSQALQLRYRQRDQSTDAGSLPNAPNHDRLLEGVYSHKGQYDEEHVIVGRREALKDFVTARVEGTYAVNPQLTLTYAAGYNQSATETTQLTVAGVKDLASVGFNYRLDSHWFGGGRYEYDRFHGQDRSSLGDGHLIELNAGYKIKADYPDYTIRAVFSHGQYSANGTPGAALQNLLPAGTPFDAQAFMPQTFTQGGLLFSFGDDLPENYSKGWRSMFSAGPLRDSRAGWSGQVMAGLVGSLFGGDQVLIYGLYQGASSNHSTSVKEIGARYQWLY